VDQPGHGVVTLPGKRRKLVMAKIPGVWKEAESANAAQKEGAAKIIPKNTQMGAW